ncbi:flagellar biosynthetic protein FliO [Myxococcota bacterium]|nr:flagellar biosynthetic protein FliO [Myxococcota bacterium]MBU1537237.1 flagellar biosynthetic protein FliO [Myxococcota bacterium]
MTDFLIFGTSGTEVPSMGWLVLKTLLLLALLGGLMYVLFRYGTAWMQLPFLKRAPKGELSLKSTLTLEPGRSLHLVGLRDREYLIASSDKGLLLLAELPASPASGEEEEESSDRVELMSESSK